MKLQKVLVPLSVLVGLVLGGTLLATSVDASSKISQKNLTVKNVDKDGNVTSKRAEKYKGNDWYKIKGTANKHAKFYVLADQDGNDPTHYSKLDTIKANKKGNWKIELQSIDKDSSVYYITPDKKATKSKIVNMNKIDDKIKVTLPANTGTAPKPFVESDYSTSITYDQLARTPKQYKGQKVALTGEVMQNDEGAHMLLVEINGNTDDVVRVKYSKSILGDTRVLEDDLVTFYGTAHGTYSYESIEDSNETVPSITAAKIVDNGKASDDYGD